MPFPLRDIRIKILAACTRVALSDGAICSKNRKIVPCHGANPNTRNGARLRSPSPIMAPGPLRRYGCVMWNRGKATSRHNMWPLTAEVIRVVYSVYEDWIISSWVDMKDMDMRNWCATVWSIYFIIILKASRLRRTMKTATTVWATRCLIADINIVDVVEFYGRLCSLLYWKYFFRTAHNDTGKLKSFL